MNNEFIDITYEKGPPVGSPFLSTMEITQP
ncbi:hypothetical protein MP35_12605 [Escherichia coli N40513]|nr:hypothetical protein MP35_12605 [Escherichia coli N40513]